MSVYHLRGFVVDAELDGEQFESLADRYIFPLFNGITHIGSLVTLVNRDTKL